MSLNRIAAATGVPEAQLEGLLQGQVGAGVASVLGTGAFVLQDFVEGDVKPAAATLLGIGHEEAEFLRRRIGREGAIGLLVGWLLYRTRKV